MRRAWLAAAIVAVARVARADGETSDTMRRADELFDRGIALRAQGDHVDSCKAFSDSLALNPNAIGTILNIARCEEEDGHVTNAIRYFTDVRDRAREQRLDNHRQAAEERLASLQARVGHVAIAFTPPLVAHVRLEVAGAAVAIEHAADVLVDPNTTPRIVVTAPDMLPFSTTVSVSAGAHVAIAVPQLASANRGHPTLGKALAIGGTGMFAIGIVVGLVALHDYHSIPSDPMASNGSCTFATTTTCNTLGYQQLADARHLGNIGTALGAAGVVAGAIGGFLWWRAPAEPGVAIVPTFGGVAAVGRF